MPWQVYATAEIRHAGGLFLEKPPALLAAEPYVIPATTAAVPS
jgi:hypothetical protein